MARTAELEIVTYRTEDMVHASRELIHNYAKYSGIPGTDLWSRMIVRVAEIIKNQLPSPCEWTTPGLSVRFSGFLPTIPTLSQGRLEYSAKSPQFELQEGWPYELRPAIRTHISNVTNAIAAEMHEVYKLEVERGDPMCLSFPKDQYAKSVDIVTVPLLTEAGN
jgi:hypothetical protein